MIRVALRATVRWCTRTLVLLLFVAIARLAFVVWQQRPPTVIVTQAPNVDSEASNQLPGGLFGLEALRSKLAPTMPSEIGMLNAVAAAGAAPQPKRIQVYLVVSVAPDRSEVVVDGVARGRTPYVGEVSCIDGGTLSIVVLPPKGLPKRFVRDCDRREIRIDERQRSPD